MSEDYYAYPASCSVFCSACTHHDGGVLRVLDDTPVDGSFVPEYSCTRPNASLTLNKRLRNYHDGDECKLWLDWSSFLDVSSSPAYSESSNFDCHVQECDVHRREKCYILLREKVLPAKLSAALQLEGLWLKFQPFSGHFQDTEQERGRQAHIKTLWQYLGAVFLPRQAWTNARGVCLPRNMAAGHIPGMVLRVGGYDGYSMVCSFACGNLNRLAVP